MIKIILETYRERDDILIWCVMHLGQGGAGETVKDGNRWARSINFSRQVYTFKNPEDATLFRLKWL